jgi:anti-anti-sigma regulatory factor
MTIESAYLLWGFFESQMLRIEKIYEGQTAVLRLSGRIQTEDIPVLQNEFEQPGEALVYDLSEIQLVDESTVRFLAECESNGISLRHCALYIREWIRRENESH